MKDHELRTSRGGDNLDVSVGLRVGVAYPHASYPAWATVDFFRSDCVLDSPKDVFARDIVLRTRLSPDDTHM